MEFIEQFKAARRVSTPLLCIRTFDAKSTTSAIMRTLGDGLATTPLLLWDAVHGLMPVNNTDASKGAMSKIIGANSQELTVPAQEMLKALEHDGIEDVIVFVANAHLHWKNDPTVVQGIWNLRDLYKSSGNMLVLLSAPGQTLPEELLNDVLVLDEPLPTLNELQTIVNETYKFAKVNPIDSTILSKATNALIGLPAFAAEQAAAMCLTYDVSKPAFKRDGNLNIEELWDRKRQIINQTPGLTFYNGKETLDDIGGIDQAKEFFRGVMEGEDPPNVIIFIDEIEKALAGTGTDMSGTKTEMNGSLLSWMQDKNITGGLLLGIPGVSKSALVKSLGNTYGKPVIVFDVAGMQNSLVGSSGGNLRAAEAIVDAISGCKVLALATCNSIAGITPELRRRFSFAEFFFDAPTREEKDIIWDIHRKKQKIATGEPNPADEGWTGAEIEKCCVKAYKLRWTLAKAAAYIVPIAVSAKETIAKTRNDASGKYLSASKPGIYYADESIEATEYVDVTRSVVAAEGRKIRDYLDTLVTA